jgi:arylsulfatase
VRFKWRFDTPERYQEYMIRYYRLITEVDAAVGRLVDELKAQGVYDNTLIVFIGDNGYFHGDRGLADKWYPYEQALRVPLIVRDPRLPARRRGMRTDRLALNLDIAPTIVSAAGLPVPEAMQGLDLSPLYLRERPPAWRDEFFYEHPTITSRDRIPSSHAVVRRDWKYVSWPEFGYEQLFDLKKDPQEVKNLAEQPAHAGRRAAMQRKLEEWRSRAR